MIEFQVDKNWLFRESGTEKWMSASIPGTVHTDLLANGVIEDPFYRTNEKDQQWIDKRDWEYKTSFEVDAAILDQEYIELRFEGLDTYATVSLNGTVIIEADNFYVTWKAAVKHLLKEGENELFIKFFSPIEKGLKLLDANGYPLPADNDQAENGGLKKRQQVSVFTRKPGYHYGWDWGPRLVTSGIWRSVKLQAWNTVRLEDLFIHQRKVSSDHAELEAVFEINAGEARALDFAIYEDGHRLISRSFSVKPGINRITVPFGIDEPKLWWTQELGTPHLYNLTGKIEWGDDIFAEQTERIGLRTIKLVQEPDEAGESFYFELNGVPVFAKGANYIPNDVFLPRVTKDKYRHILQSAVDANMNMLRIWGGGFYESDYFYELCDEMGIMVWQDFMFACSMYPGNPDFLDKVREEAISNVKRLRNHASIVLWCGNNEMDFAWQEYKEFGGWGWKQRYNREKRVAIWEAYQTIFHDLLPEVVDQYAPGIFYWPSSPWAGPKQHATDRSTSGDIHYWGVWHGKEPFTAFNENIGRFMSEYGFQSFPEFEAVKSYTISSDWDIESEVMAAHQRSGIGNLRIKRYMEDHFQVPQRFDHLLYVGQLLQAKGIRMGIEAHRMAKPYCMGSLYWQLNDCWPVASWSSIDYYGNWKALQYAARDAFEPIILATQLEKSTIKVFVVSDRLQSMEGILRMKWIDFSGAELWYHSTPTQVKANTATKINDFTIDPIKALGRLNEGYLKLELEVNQEVICEKVVYLVPEKELDLPQNPALEWNLDKQEDSLYSISLKTSTLAKNVYLNFEGTRGYFSDNYFDLLPNESRQITFRPEVKDEFPAQDQLKAITLVDTR